VHDHSTDHGGAAVGDQHDNDDGHGHGPSAAVIGGIAGGIAAVAGLASFAAYRRWSRTGMLRSTTSSTASVKPGTGLELSASASSTAEQHVVA
jgi:hypothetical protein